MRPIRTIVLGLLSACSAIANGPAYAGPVITGTAIISGAYDAAVGNQGNPSTGLHVPVSAPGTYIVGPLTGSGGGNTTQGSMTIALGLAPTLTGLPTITATATGFDSPNSLDAAFTQFTPNLSYNFAIVGPQVIPVPVLFAGTTSGTLTSTGDPNRLVGHVGTGISIVANGIANTFVPVGQQTGTAPDALASNANRVNLGWGFQAFGPVNYTSYSSDWEWGASLFVGQVGTITMTTNTEGGTTGQLRGLAVLTGSTATSMIDPQIFIDPAWLVLHPGYSIVVDESVGNGLAAVGPGPGPGAVPEPGSVVLLLAGVFGAASMTRRRREAAA
jgi:PEP-CTERM motif